MKNEDLPYNLQLLLQAPRIHSPRQKGDRVASVLVQTKDNWSDHGGKTLSSPG